MRTLSVKILCNWKLSPPFEKRVAYILLHSTNLTRFDLFSNLQGNMCRQRLSLIFAVLEKSVSKPELSFQMCGSKEANEMVLRLKDKLPIIAAHVDSKEVDFWLQFHQLRYITMWCFEDRETPIAMDKLLANLPLTKLTVLFPGSVEIFPPQLRCLNLNGIGTSTLQLLTWKAACELRELHTIKVTAEDIKKTDGFPRHLQFQSSQLRRVRLNLNASSETKIKRYIIQPIFKHCHQIESVTVDLYTSISSDFLTWLFSPNETLTFLHVTSTASMFSFRDLIAATKHLPNLKTLTLPWPAPVDSSEEDNGSIDWPDDVEDHCVDIPERLTFSQCQSLATACPKLNRVEFRVDDSDEAGNHYWIWNKYNVEVTSSFRVPLHMPINAKEIESWRKSQYARLQSFKMFRFIDDASPCLNICTLFFHFGDTHYPDTEGIIYQSIVLFVDLNQVRRHSDHLYSPFFPLINDDSCGKGCRLLLEGMKSRCNCSDSI